MPWFQSAVGRPGYGPDFISAFVVGLNRPEPVVQCTRECIPTDVSPVMLQVEFNENNAGGASTVVGQFVGAEMTKVHTPMRHTYDTGNTCFAFSFSISYRSSDS